MKSLTKTEEEIMQIVWRLGPCTVSQIIEDMGDPKPPHSSISSIVRILEKKAFVDHKAYGRTYEYFPKVSKEEYSKRTINQLVTDYFEGSMNRLVSFLVKQENVNPNELSELLKDLEDKTE